MARLTRALLIPALLLFATASANAGLIYFGTDQGNIYTVDTSNGDVVNVGDPGVTFTDVAFDPMGNLYGITFSQLYSIDLGANTATAAPGALGAAGNGLAFDSSGTLYMSGDTGLYTVNTGTGNAAFQGGTGFASAGDLEFDGDGNLYMTATGSPDSRLIGFGNPISLPGALIGSDLGYTNVFGLAYAGNTMWGLSNQSLFTIDLVTGQGSAPVFELDIEDGEIVWGAAAAVPEPGTLVLVGSGLIALVLWRRRENG